MISGMVTEATLQGRPMYCIECREQFIHFDPDRLQPKEEGIYLNCEKHKAVGRIAEVRK